MTSAVKGLGFPKKSSIKDANNRTRKRSRLATQRRKVHTAVKDREGGRCAICRWNIGTDYHHVYGRSSDPTNWREQDVSGLWVCRECHPHGYLHNRGDDPALEKILEECINGTRFPDWMQPFD